MPHVLPPIFGKSLNAAVLLAFPPEEKSRSNRKFSDEKREDSKNPRSIQGLLQDGSGRRTDGGGKNGNGI
jgi:hypothetical protein